ncbi:MAG: amidohydrolase family protein [Pseudomonadota bacterium]
MDNTEAINEQAQAHHAKPVTHRAEWVVVEKNNILQNGYVVVHDGFVIEIGKGGKTLDGPIVDHGNGVILPGLVNAHTHLELCALKNRVASQSGFLPWVQELLAQRSGLEPEILRHEASLGIEQLLLSGCIAAGDISTTGITRELFVRSPLLGIWFQEFLGTHPDKILTCRKGPRQSISLAGHAPHTTSPELLTRLKTLSSKGKLRFSIHLAESNEESEFIAGGKGAWADFLTERGIDFSFWGVGKNLTPVQHADQLGLLDADTIAVHLIQAHETDFEILRKNGSSVCLCLRSNQALHGTLPDVPSMMKHNINLCLGTDSLASVDTLSILDEMKFAATCFPEIPPADILEMATANGARALGLDGLTGTLRPGERGSFPYLDLTAGNIRQLMEAIVHASFQEPVKQITA